MIYLKYVCNARLVVSLVVLTYATFGQADEQANTMRAPNLIVILTDDQGYADVGFNGCQDIPTPHLDSLAADGVRFTNGYVSYSVCGPSRAGLMTGRYQDRFGFCTNPTINPENEKAGLPLDERTLAEALQSVGYSSMAVGKWHLGTHPTLQPLKRGFDEFFGFLSGGHNYLPEQLVLHDLSDVRKQWDWYLTKLLRNEQRVGISEYLTDELSNAAVDFIERRHDEPFFLYVAYNAPHTPLQATPKYLKRFQHIKDSRRRTYAAMISAVDDGVGRILAEVAEHNLEQDTLIFYLSDNGGPIGRKGSVNGSRNDPLRGGKGSPFEGGIRVPFAARWTGNLPAGVDYDQPVISLDIFATIASRAGVSIPPERPLDGVDLMPFLTGEKKGQPHERLLWRWRGKDTLVVREGATKLIADGRQGRDSLFDLAHDIGESENLADQQADTVRRLRQQLQSWNEQLKEQAFPGLGSWLNK